MTLFEKMMAGNNSDRLGEGIPNNVNNVLKSHSLRETKNGNDNAIQGDEKLLPDPVAYSFNDLIFDLQNSHGQHGILVANDWSHGIEWHLEVNGKIKDHAYLDDPGVNLSKKQLIDNNEAWINKIPKDILLAIKPFRTLNFTLLYHVRKYLSAYELFISHPNLLWFLLNHARENGWSESAVVRCLSLKRPLILKACGCPGTKAAVKLLKKLRFRKFGDAEFKLMKKLLKIDGYEKINHLDKVDLLLADLLCTHPGLAGSRYLQHYTPKDWGLGLEIYLDEILLMAEQLHLADIVDRIGRFASIDDFYSLYERLVNKMNRTPLEAFDNVVYPEPPVPGNEAIIPVTTSHELAREGIEQQHCVRCFHQHIVSGVYYIYRVMQPERATLCLINLGEGMIAIDELALKNNQEVSEATLRFVKDWLESHDTKVCALVRKL